MILIVAEENDMHALAVARALLARNPLTAVTIIDAQAFPSRAHLEINLNEWILCTNDNRVIRSSDVTAIWWRRLLPHDISKSVKDPTARSFCANESGQAFRTIAYWPGYKVVNDVARERVATHKPLQHRIAHKLGIRIPSTLVTNNPAKVVEFYKRHKNIIYKVMTTPISSFAETRRFRDQDIDLLQTLCHAPIIFQQEVEKSKDIRVTVVGEKVFAASIAGKLDRGALFPDWRLDATAECKSIELPENVVTQLLSLTRTLGLDYCAIDLIQDVAGDFVFLEVNPSGQFLFVEIDTGQPISGAIAEMLLEPQFRGPGQLLPSMR